MLEILIIVLLALVIGIIIAKVILIIKDLKDQLEMIHNNINILDKGVSDLYEMLFGEDDDDMKGYE